MVALPLWGGKLTTYRHRFLQWLGIVRVGQLSFPQLAFTVGLYL
jgi:hypothetical protein